MGCPDGGVCSRLCTALVTRAPGPSVLRPGGSVPTGHTPLESVWSQSCDSQRLLQLEARPPVSASLLRGHCNPSFASSL